MTRIRFYFTNKEQIKPVSNIKQYVMNLRKTDKTFLRWEYC